MNDAMRLRHSSGMAWKVDIALGAWLGARWGNTGARQLGLIGIGSIFLEGWGLGRLSKN
jgi:hypothetical protein